MIRLFPFLSLITVILTACSIIPIKNLDRAFNSPQWHQHQQDISRLKQYQTCGTFAYISDQKKFYTRFFWKQIDQNNYCLLLLNPVGGIELKITAQSGQIQISNSKNKNYTSIDIEEMIGKFTTMSIPLNNLRQWILGLPGNATDYKLDEQYHLSEVNYNQNGKTWKVIYVSYDTKTIPVLPSKMELTEDSQRIKLKMDYWIVK